MRQPQSLARPQKLLGEAKGVPSSAERPPPSHPLWWRRGEGELGLSGSTEDTIRIGDIGEGMR